MDALEAVAVELGRTTALHPDDALYALRRLTSRYGASLDSAQRLLAAYSTIPLPLEFLDVRAFVDELDWWKEGDR